jgi:hypothetical protein
MTRRHFELVANALKNLRDEPAADQPTLDMVARELARTFAQTNPNFNPDRFFAATNKPQR